MVTVHESWHEKYNRDGSLRKQKKPRKRRIDYFLLATHAAILFISCAFYMFLLSLAVGCSAHTISITPGCVNATSTATIYCPEATVIRVMDGNRTVDMIGESSGVGAVVTGVLKP